MVLANVGALAVNPHLIKVPYDPLRDLAPLTWRGVRQRPGGPAIACR